MLRIRERESAAHTMHVEGRLVGPWVKELRRSCEAAAAAGRQVAIDLADVDFADLDGLALLLELRDEGFDLVNCSAFLREQLRAAGAR
ncbi:MAG: STAS domain-containing protein [Candidatus Rokuibacteriota bacterium]